MAQQRLRRHHDERLAEVALHLATQNVEVVGRRRDVCHLHIVFRTKLEITFQTRRGVFRPLTFKTMRQKADETRHTQPLAFARRDELVKHDLRTIGEVTKLGFPQNKRAQVRQRIAVFVAEDGFFREASN